jgi:hypothetical protein
MNATVGCRMKVKLALLAILLAVCAPLQVEAQEVAGQVREVIGPRAARDAWIERSAGGTEVARPYMLLKAGDQVMVRANALQVMVLLQGERAPRTITAAESPFRVPESVGQRPSAAAAAFLQSIDYLFKTRAHPFPVYTESRAMPGALSADPLAPSGPQSLPRGAEEILALWRGGGARVRLAEGARSWTETESGPQSWVVIPTLGLEAFSLSVEDAVSWEIIPAEPRDIPRAPWQAWDGDLAGGDRLARAVWILSTPEKGCWRLFALGEIRMLSDDDLAARRVWEAVLSGDFRVDAEPPSFGCAPPPPPP